MYSVMLNLHIPMLPQAKSRGIFEKIKQVQQAVDSVVSQGTVLDQVLFSK